MSDASVIGQILDLARWAPSGDNTQPWRFEIVGPSHLVVHGFDTRTECVYDLDGHPSQVSLGALLETIAIAASAHGLRADARRRPITVSTPETEPTFDVHLVVDANVKPSPLLAAIPQRSVQRRPMRMRPLSAEEKLALQDSVGADFHVDWLEGLGLRYRTARLMYRNAKLRLTMPEAYQVHRRIIAWNASTSEDRVPDQALGVDAMTLRLMKWAMVSWRRLSTMNALMGTWAPRLQMDMLPGLACGAHFVISATTVPVTIDDYVAAGRKVQRFWLTVTHLGLQLQPEMTPLIFARYSADERRFTVVGKLIDDARRLRRETAALVPCALEKAVFMGRLGAGKPPPARSLRLPLEKLIKLS